MTTEQLIQELATEGLRLASEDEAGWNFFYYNEDEERVVIWVTDLN